MDRMAKQRGHPDRRGMGAQSDFIGETFVPDQAYQEKRRSMAQTLIAGGMKPEQVAAMLSLPLHLVAGCAPRILSGSGLPPDRSGE
jgi:hypothetical protein